MLYVPITLKGTKKKNNNKDTHHIRKIEEKKNKIKNYGFVWTMCGCMHSKFLFDLTKQLQIFVFSFRQRKQEELKYQEKYRNGICL